jgi:predicted enzyme related to lactoylglutathione lyase
MLVAHAYIEVTDAAAGIAFYCDGLGLRLKRRLSPGWIELEGANLPVFLLANRPARADLGHGRTAERVYERHWTPVHLDFVVDELDAAVARLTARGGTLDRAPADREYGRIAWMADPFGNGFDLIEFNAAGYDAVSRAG